VSNKQIDYFENVFSLKRDGLAAVARDHDGDTHSTGRNRRRKWPTPSCNRTLFGRVRRTLARYRQSYSSRTGTRRRWSTGPTSAPTPRVWRTGCRTTFRLFENRKSILTRFLYFHLGFQTLTEQVRYGERYHGARRSQVNASVGERRGD